MHSTWPKTNAEWWRTKIESNVARDRMVNEQLRSAGWLVIRVWGHEEPHIAAQRVSTVVQERRARLVQLDAKPIESAFGR